MFDFGYLDLGSLIKITFSAQPMLTSGQTWKMPRLFMQIV